MRRLLLALLLVACDPDDLPVPASLSATCQRAWTFYGRVDPLPEIRVHGVDCHSPFGPGWTLESGECVVGLYNERMDVVTFAANGLPYEERVAHELYHAVQWNCCGVKDAGHRLEGWESGGRVDRCIAFLRGKQ